MEEIKSFYFLIPADEHVEALAQVVLALDDCSPSAVHRPIIQNQKPNNLFKYVPLIIL